MPPTTAPPAKSRKSWVAGTSTVIAYGVFAKSASALELTISPEIEQVIVVALTAIVSAGLTWLVPNPPKPDA